MSKYVVSISQTSTAQRSLGGLTGGRERRGGGGLFTIGIAEEDRPRRWRAHRHCPDGRAVGPITYWVALAPGDAGGGSWAPQEQAVAAGSIREASIIRSIRSINQSSLRSAATKHEGQASSKTRLAPCAPCSTYTRASRLVATSLWSDGAAAAAAAVRPGDRRRGARGGVLLQAAPRLIAPALPPTLGSRPRAAPLARQIKEQGKSAPGVRARGTEATQGAAWRGTGGR